MWVKGAASSPGTSTALCTLGTPGHMGHPGLLGHPTQPGHPRHLGNKGLTRGWGQQEPAVVLPAATFWWAQLCWLPTSISSCVGTPLMPASSQGCRPLSPRAFPQPGAGSPLVHFATLCYTSLILLSNTLVLERVVSTLRGIPWQKGPW